MINKIFASIRYKVYTKIRHIIREEKRTNITKGELTHILKDIDVWQIRNDVFDLFGFGELNEPTHRTLIKAHLHFLTDNSTNSYDNFDH